MMFKKLSPVVASAVLLLALAAAPAAASTITYDLGSPNAALSSYPGPYATVSVDLTNSTTATITFTSLSQTSGGNTYAYKLGGTGAADVNVNSTNFSVSNISFTGGCTGAGCPSGGTAFTQGSGSVSSFGSFNLTLKDADGVGDAVHSVSFTLTDIGGTWANAAAVLALNAANYLTAGHIFVFENGVASTAVLTGFAGNSGVAFTPEAGSEILFALALIVLCAVFARRERFVEAA